MEICFEKFRMVLRKEKKSFRDELEEGKRESDGEIKKEREREITKDERKGERIEEIDTGGDTLLKGT